MQEFIFTLVVFALAGLGLGVGLFWGRRRRHAGCGGPEPLGQDGTCGRSDCCSAARQSDVQDRSR